MKIIEKLSTYAALIGVIGAIGGGFYTWGQFNLRLDQIESKEFVVNETVDLTDIEVKLKELETTIISLDNDVLDKLDKKLRTPLKELEEYAWELEEDIEENSKGIAIIKKENELQDVQIEEIKLSTSNPLGG